MVLFREDPGCGNLITFSQFVFIALDGFLFTTKLGTVKSKIKMKDYMVLVSFFFISSVLNNYAFNFNIPMPLHMIFRAVRNIKKKMYNGNSCVLKPKCIIYNSFLGFSDSQYDYGYYHFKENIYFRQVFVSINDNHWHYHLYHNKWQGGEINGSSYREFRADDALG